MSVSDDRTPHDQDDDLDEGTLDDLDPQPAPTRPPTPYSEAAGRYLAAGWRGVLPLPARKKSTPPQAWTGEGGAWSSAADVQNWIEEGVHGRRADGTPYHFHVGNIALRLPPDVIGFDVDAYEGKAGAQTFYGALGELGQLPPTWTSSSRGASGDGVSGIRVYRLPVLDGQQVTTAGWPGVLGPGVELIRTGHRYMLVAPSVHPDTGATYAWSRPDGVPTLEVPRVEDLPFLPEAWARHLQAKAKAVAGKSDLGPDEAVHWLDGFAGSSTHPCGLVQGFVQHVTPSLMGQDGGSRHDAMLGATARLARAATEGHHGYAWGLAQVRSVFVAAAGGGGRDVAGEWNRAVLGAVQLAAHAHGDQPVPADPCTQPRDPLAGLIAPADRTDLPCPDRSSPPSVTSSSAPTSSTSAAPPTPGATPNGATSPSGESGSPAATAQPTTAPTAVPSAPAPSTPAETSSTADPEAQARAQAMLQAVSYEVDRLRIRDLAQEAYADEKRAKVPAAPWDFGRLADVLARPPEPPMRVEGLVPWDASTLLVAKRKSGKTTLLLNYARSLLTGEDFLGRFPVIPLDGRVGILNFEVSGRQLARWADDVGVDRDRLVLANLRGRRNPLADPADQAELADMLRREGVETLIVDPFGRAYTGAAQNDAGEVGQWLVNLDYFARTEAGARDLVLAAHAGWNGERTRGSSALEDWADTILTLTREEDQDGAPAYLRAMGRDVDLDEDALDFDLKTRTLTLAGTGGRKASKRSRDLEPIMGGIVQALEHGPHTGVASLESALRHAGLAIQSKGDTGKAASELVRRGLVRESVGPRNARVFTLNRDGNSPPPRTPPHPPAAGGSEGPQSPLRTTKIIGGVAVDGHTGEVL